MCPLMGVGSMWNDCVVQEKTWYSTSPPEHAMLLTILTISRYGSCPMPNSRIVAVGKSGREASSGQSSHRVRVRVKATKEEFGRWNRCSSSHFLRYSYSPQWRHSNKTYRPLLRSLNTGCPDRKSTRLNSSHLGISYAV